MHRHDFNMKNYLFLLLVLLFVSVPSVNAQRANGRKTTSTTKTSSTKKIVGTFKFNDDVCEWTVEFNSDRTCQFSSRGNTYYGAWTFVKNPVTNSEYFFVDMSDHMYLYKDGGRTLYIPMIDKECKWLYENGRAFDAKHPKRRVKLTRIK